MNEIITHVPDFGEQQMRSVERGEAAKESREMSLRKQGIVLTGEAISSREVMLEKYSINGQLLAEITLPVANEAGRDYKKLGLIDFGPDVDENNPVPLAQYQGGEILAAGRTKNRYGIVALNYTPPGRVVGFMPLISGEAVIVGRGKSDSLGLPDNKLHEHVSKNQIAIRQSEAGIMIMDASTNGSIVRVPESTTETYPVERDVLTPEIQETMQRIESGMKELLGREAYRGGREAKLLVNYAYKLIAERPKAASEVEEVVLHNRLGGKELPELLGKFRQGDELIKQLRLLEIYQKSPEAAHAIVEHQVGGFHATQSGALLGILEHRALLSAAEARSRDAMVATGERTYSQREGQRYLSFADWRSPGTIEYYAGNPAPVTLEQLEKARNALDETRKVHESIHGVGTLLAHNAAVGVADLDRQIAFIRENPRDVMTSLMQQNFPIAFGLDVSRFDHVGTTIEVKKDQDNSNVLVQRALSDAKGEFITLGREVGLDRLPVVAVPAVKIQEVEQLFRSRGYHAEVIDIELITKADRLVYGGAF